MIRIIDCRNQMLLRSSMEQTLVVDHLLVNPDHNTTWQIITKAQA